MKRLALLLLCLHSTLPSAAPRVVTSIAPLQEIAGALMAGVAAPRLIIEDHASVHHFAFKPSHMRLLQQADLVIWIDRHFEAGFNRIAQTLPLDTRTIELMPLLEIENEDGHFWYSPSLLRQSIEILAAALGEVDPENQSQYRENARRLSLAVSAWHERLRTRWQGSTPRLLTDHDFLRHFARDLGQFEIESPQDHHGAQRGLKDLQRIEQWLRIKPAACLLTLDPTPPPLSASLAAKYHLPIVSIPAIDMPASEVDPILARLERLQIALENCLADLSATLRPE